jgi:hypothetical protein
MQDGIRAAVQVLANVLAQAAKDAAEAHRAMQRNEQNVAIGTLVPAEDAIEQATALYRAIIAMHGFRDRGRS